MRSIIITTSSFWPDPSLFKFEGLTINVVKLPKLPEFLGGILTQVVQAKQDVKDGTLQRIFKGKL